MIKCPNCGAMREDGARFCEQCQYDFQGMPRVESRSETRPFVGEKAVVAGDVSNTVSNSNNTTTTNNVSTVTVGSQESYSVSGNATIIKNEDETKKMVRCHLCGKNITIVGVYTCPECGQTVCAQCYDVAMSACAKCARVRIERNVASFVQTLRDAYDDGHVDENDRERIRKQAVELGITTEQARTLESQIRQESERQAPLGEYERLYCAKAEKQLWGDGDARGALETLCPVYRAHPLDPQVQLVQFAASILANEEQARSEFSSMEVDCVPMALALIDSDFRNERYVDAERGINRALAAWPKDSNLRVRLAISLYCSFAKFGKDENVIAAWKIAKEIPRGQSRLLDSWIEYLESLCRPFVKDANRGTKERALDKYCFLVDGRYLGLSPVRFDQILSKCVETASGHFSSLSLTPDELSAITKASECEDLDATLSLGVWEICQGRKLSQTNLVEDGIRHVREVANADFSPPASKLILGMLLESGIVDSADRAESLKWFRLADSSGCPGACEKVAEIERRVKDDQRREHERLEAERHQQEMRLKEVQMAQRKPILELIENGLVKIPDKEIMVARTHVTQELWKAVMGDNPSRFKGADYPVESISWKQGRLFVERLNEDEEVMHRRLKFRLPLTAEIEYQNLGCYGDTRGYDNYSWSRANSEYSTHPVGTKKPTSIGVFDKDGNVMTWCDDECNLSGFKFVAGSSWCDSLTRGGGIAELDNAFHLRRIIKHDWDIVPEDAKCSCVGLRLVAYKN